METSLSSARPVTSAAAGALARDLAPNRGGAEPPTHATAPSGPWEQRRRTSAGAVPYYLYVPSSFVDGGPLLVTVHGISRNAGEHLRRFAAYAERYGVAVAAPLFERTRFPKYQRLDANAAGERPDAVLEQVANEAAAHAGADARRLYLFGYSGGGQFVHRYVLAHAHRVARYVVGAAGWYTFPDPARRYPYGLRRATQRIPGSFLPAEFLAVPGRVLVGERDVARGTAMRVSDRLIGQQGGSRFERAARWVAAMNDAAAANGLPPPVSLEVLPRSPHSFARSMRRGNMGERVFGFLFDSRPAEDGTAAA